MKKLTKAQQEVMDKAIREIDYARNCRDVWDYTIRNYVNVLAGTATEADKVELRERQKQWFAERPDRPDLLENMTRHWHRTKEGYVHTRCNSKTIQKLAALGLIEIEYDSNGDWLGIDTIKVLNY